ncbi:hypothetical protein GOP47_0007505 [Adiantum capillus-veneris]|uniref:Transcription initiation factor TFIID component TAF4 C-terminal domain-containing protein n=1 Tax=Adiantum capillus-veneris TaxID=13818 RepID=A0A9D4ZLK9_ADICA|nr:hypothetical protein GOP47_0007505 [Adiantum capillus-veneris]
MSQKREAKSVLPGDFFDNLKKHAPDLTPFEVEKLDEIYRTLSGKAALNECRELLGSERVCTAVRKTKEEKEKKKEEQNAKASLDRPQQEPETTDRVTSKDEKRPAYVLPIAQVKSKKQRVAEDVLEQSTNQSGLNLQKDQKEQQPGPNKATPRTQAMERLAQEEGPFPRVMDPLRAKLIETAAKHGISIGNEEVDKCLSVCLEERMYNMIQKLGQIADRRYEKEKEFLELQMTSHIQKKIALVHKRGKGAQEKTQAQESEQLRERNEVSAWAIDTAYNAFNLTLTH